MEAQQMGRLCQTIPARVLAVCAVAALSGCSDPDKAVGGRLTELQKVVEAMKGNLCRCAAYIRIKRAIKRVVQGA